MPARRVVNKNRHLSPEELECNINGAPVTENKLRYGICIYIRIFVAFVWGMYGVHRCNIFHILAFLTYIVDQGTKIKAASVGVVRQRKGGRCVYFDSCRSMPNGGRILPLSHDGMEVMEGYGGVVME